MLQGLSDTIIELLISSEANRDGAQVESVVASFSEALADSMERVLGAPKGSLNLVDSEALKAWFSTEETRLTYASEV
jgi:hypothetical protein